MRSQEQTTHLLTQLSHRADVSPALNLSRIGHQTTHWNHSNSPVLHCLYPAPPCLSWVSPNEGSGVGFLSPPSCFCLLTRPRSPRTLVALASSLGNVSNENLSAALSPHVIPQSPNVQSSFIHNFPKRKETKIPFHGGTNK